MTGSARSTPIGTFDSSTIVASSTANEGPGGLIGYIEIVANSSGTSTVENYGVINTVPVSTGRLIMITATGKQRATGPTGLQTKIIEDSTDLNRLDHSIWASGTDAAFHIVAFSHSPSAGNHNYTLAGGIAGSSGETATLIADSDNVTIVQVFDCGPDF